MNTCCDRCEFDTKAISTDIENPQRTTARELTEGGVRVEQGKVPGIENLTRLEKSVCKSGSATKEARLLFRTRIGMDTGRRLAGDDN
jgi:hypothetical protein